MLSFELSAIDLILMIAVIILLILYITKLSTKTSTQEKLLVEEKKTSKEPATETTIPEEENKRLTSKPQRDSTKCPYGFGYLKKLDKNASIPDKCLGCSKIMECFSANE
jgi:Sec-independent protein translocase protein TatA